MPKGSFAAHAGVRQKKRFRLLLVLSSLAFAALALPAKAADGRAVKVRVPPVYPEIAKRMHVTGEVRVSALVDAQGNVKNVKALSGNGMLAVAAENAVRQWKFAPGDGDETVVVSINFTVGQ